MRHFPQIPPPNCWPAGFTTNYVSYFPDKIPNRGGGLTNLKWAAFWHDLGYWYGHPMHSATPGYRLKALKPRPTDQRSDHARKMIDKQFHANLRHLGVDRWFAWIMYRTVRRLGSRNYWWTRTRDSWEEA